MSTSSHSRRSNSHSSSHSTRSSKEKKMKCGRPTYYKLRSRSCSRSHRSKDSKEYHRNHDRGRDRGRERRHGRRASSSRSRNSISRSRSRSYSKSYSPGDRRRGYHHRHVRSPSRSPSQRSYWSSRSRGSYYSSAGRRSSRSFHRRDRHWSRSRSYSRDRYYNRGPGGYHPPYPPYNGRGAPHHPVAMIPMHPGNGNTGYRSYSNPHGPYGTGYGAQYGNAGAYHPSHSHHGEVPPNGYYGVGGARDRDRDKGPPQLHKRRHDGPPGVSLLVRHIAPTISTQHLFQVFTQKLPHLTPPRDIYIPRDFHSHQPKGFAFVEYTSFEQAREARSEMDKMVLHGREIEAVFAQDKRKTPSQMRDRHLDDAYGGGDVSKFNRGHESSSSFERHKRKERQKERRERNGCEENSKGSSPLKSK